MNIELQYIGPEATQELIRYTQAKGWHRFTLVADERTWHAWGEKVYAALSQSGADVQCVLLQGQEVIADEARIVEILLPGDQQQRVFIAVGSGTITDLTRFVSHRLGRPFIALPTAPSVDAYSSANAPLILRRFKRTVMAHQPVAIVAEMDVLCKAPFLMIAAGVGDILGKYTALADWRLAALLWEEPIDFEIVADMYHALESVVQNAKAIGRREPHGIASLMEALLASGAAMARWVNSRPASGSEHHISHYWEMRWLQENRPPALHGAKVGVATVLMARAYARLRAISYEEMHAILAQAHPPMLEVERERIRAGLGPFAEEILAEQGEFLAPPIERWERFKHRILSQWQDIQAIARDVPPPQEIIALLRSAGAPTHPAALGLSPAEVKDALRYAHYLRNRFTIQHFYRLLGLI